MRKLLPRKREHCNDSRSFPSGIIASAWRRVRKDGESSRHSHANNGCVVWMNMSDSLHTYHNYYTMLLIPVSSAAWSKNGGKIAARLPYPRQLGVRAGNSNFSTHPHPATVDKNQLRNRLQPDPGELNKPFLYGNIYISAGVVKLADTLGSGPSARKGVGVQVPSPAPFFFRASLPRRVKKIKRCPMPRYSS